MHDCPACRVPLHGYEEVCPSCGTRQAVRRGSKFSSFKAEQPGINWIPFVLCFFVVGIVVVIGMSGSWIGKLATEGPPQVDPLEKMTYSEARNLLEQELVNGLTSVGAKVKLSWTDANDGSPADKALDKPLNLTVDTALSDPNSRKPIIDKVKDYMDKGKVPTLTMNDEKTHAHWTYNVVAPISPSSAEE